MRPESIARRGAIVVIGTFLDDVLERDVAEIAERQRTAAPALEPSRHT